MSINELNQLRAELKKNCMSYDNINIVLNAVITIYGDDKND